MPQRGQAVQELSQPWRRPEMGLCSEGELLARPPPAWEVLGPELCALPRTGEQSGDQRPEKRAILLDDLPGGCLMVPVSEHHGSRISRVERGSIPQALQLPCLRGMGRLTKEHLQDHRVKPRGHGLQQGGSHYLILPPEVGHAGCPVLFPMRRSVP